MSINYKIMQCVRDVLEQFGGKYIANGKVKKTKVIEDLDKYNKDLIEALLSKELIHNAYTEKVSNIEIFKLNQFVEMFEYQEFWGNSFTKYIDRIGLTSNGKFIDDSSDVVLDFPYKDAVLKAGMTKEDINKDVGTDELFLNETLAHSEISELFEPKILVNAKRYDINGKRDAISFDDKDNLIIKGNNLIALHTIAKKYAGKIKLIYLDPPYNTGSDSFRYNDRFNQSTWLTFMKNRLEEAQELLSDDGHIVIQTDDNEQAYLKVLMDSIFGSENYVNTVSVLFKNIAGASGGGEDKRLKKNIEYLTIYAKDYKLSRPFNNVYDYKEVGQLVKEMRENGVSWKYTSVLVNPGTAEYLGSAKDGSGREIKIFKRRNFKIKSISKLMKDENLTEEEAYFKYGNRAFQTAMPQSSIRPTVMKKYRELDSSPNELLSIKYVPKTGKNKGKEYEQFYKGDKFRLLAWLKDVSVSKNGKLYKSEKQGTFWNFVGATKNVNKEGQVSFPNGKKPEELLSRIIKMATNKNDIVLDMFLGSGSTAATAMKLSRQFIGIEQIDDQIEIITKRLSNVINGEQSGISKDSNWQGGGSFVYAELMEKNQAFLHELQKATTIEELNDIYNRMKQNADLNFRVDLDKFENDFEHNLLSFEKQKKILIGILDKNQLYYNAGNIADADVHISDSDYQFNKSFYNKEETE